MNLQELTEPIRVSEMKNKLTFLLLILISFGCTREEEDLPLARFATTANIFTDDFIGLGSDFYFPYLEAKPDVFSVDDIGFESNASIRIDVPNSNDPGGSFAGGIFRIDGAGRDLTEYNALTFWARSSQAATIAEIGLGQDFLGDQFRAFRTNLDFTTQWQKFIIPLPDPSKLLQERGVFQFAAGGIGDVPGEEVGYTFWIDELRFENLASVAQPLPQIFNGSNENVTTFNGVSIPITGANVTYNVNGDEVPVNAAAAYFNFVSSDQNIATIDQTGTVTLNNTGSATITASIGTEGNEIEAEGLLEVTSIGDFDAAPTPPTRNESDVVSIFSDVYTNVPVDNYNGFFQFSTTQGGAINIAGENIISYTQLNFVSINMFNSPNVDASNMTHVHVDINIREAVSGGDFIRFQLINNNGPTETSASVQLADYSPLLQEQWVSYDIPLADFAGIGTDDIDLIFFVSDATISNIYVDNVYFYIE